MSDSIVKDCIETLSKIVNVSTGLAHPLDDSRAKELFKALHAKGVVLDEDEIYDIAIANGWKDSHAKKLSQLAEKIGNGGRVVIKHPRGWGEPTVEKIMASY
ncbi:DUF1889 family protein [Pseudoalteromonas ruthenica]|uniref:DUF1889 family protein n=1 Tax=Pseudoalteromonas ruthenica TaxID=151081 RepID=UPI00034DA517|nr:DUF1889 family protein [Pseudoalteromonas ruthenica]